MLRGTREWNGEVGVEGERGLGGYRWGGKVRGMGDGGRGLGEVRGVGDGERGRLEEWEWGKRVAGR